MRVGRPESVDGRQASFRPAGNGLPKMPPSRRHGRSRNQHIPSIEDLRLSRPAAQHRGCAGHGGAGGSGRTHGRTLPAHLPDGSRRRCAGHRAAAGHGQPALGALLVSGGIPVRPPRHQAVAAGLQPGGHGRLRARAPDSRLAGRSGRRRSLHLLVGHFPAGDPEPDLQGSAARQTHDGRQHARAGAPHSHGARPLAGRPFHRHLGRARRGSPGLRGGPGPGGGGPAAAAADDRRRRAARPRPHRMPAA